MKPNNMSKPGICKPEGGVSETKLLIKHMLAHAGLSLNKAIRLVNEMHPDNTMTPQNIGNKLTRDTINFTEVSRIASVCGYEIVLKPINATKTYDDVVASLNNSKDKPKEQGDIKPSFAELLTEGYAACKGINFDTIIVAGKDAERATAWIEKNLDEEMSDVQEMIVILAANREFHVMAKPADNANKKYTVI